MYGGEGVLVVLQLLAVFDTVVFVGTHRGGRLLLGTGVMTGPCDRVDEPGGERASRGQPPHFPAGPPAPYYAKQTEATGEFHYRQKIGICPFQKYANML